MRTFTPYIRSLRMSKCIFSVNTPHLITTNYLFAWIFYLWTFIHQSDSTIKLSDITILSEALETDKHNSWIRLQGKFGKFSTSVSLVGGMFETQKYLYFLKFPLYWFLNCNFGNYKHIQLAVGQLNEFLRRRLLGGNGCRSI